VQVWFYGEAGEERPLPEWWAIPIETTLRIWCEERDKFSEQLKKRREKGYADFAPAEKKKFEAWQARGHERRLILSRKTRSIWRDAHKSSQKELKNHGIALHLKIVELEEKGTYKVLFKALKSDYKEIKCMLVPQVLVASSDGPVDLGEDDADADGDGSGDENEDDDEECEEEAKLLLCYFKRKPRSFWETYEHKCTHACPRCSYVRRIL